MKRVICTTMCFSIFVSGCASIMCGDEKTIHIISHPAEADFIVTDAHHNVIIKDVTPTNVTLKRGRGWFQAGDYNVTFKKEGYKLVTMPIRQGLETGWYLFGNVAFGGLLGHLIIDPVTGAMWTIEDVNVYLQRD